jgi:DNA-binding transcriptional ArsR family regulator
MSAAEAQATAAPARLFAALGDPTRLSLLERLSAGDALSIVNLSANTNLTRQAVAKHLGVLEDVGLVASMRVGRESRYAYKPHSITAARTYLDDMSAQ